MRDTEPNKKRENGHSPKFSGFSMKEGILVVLMMLLMVGAGMATARTTGG